VTTARDVALDVSLSIRTDDAFANLILPNAIRDAHLSPRDAGHATDLTYGTQRWRDYLDAILDECVTGSLRRVDAGVLDLLRLATYELAVRNEPAHIVNEWVNRTKKRFRRATGFVNGTLRTVSSRSGAEWRQRLESHGTGSAMRATLWSHPQWIVDEYLTLVGELEVDQLLAANNESPTPTLIALPGVGSKPDGAASTELSPYGFTSPGGSLAAIHGVVEGVVRVQDEGSQLAALALVAAMPLRTGERWLDLCAGPGGKTALLAACAVAESIDLVANEVQPHRAELVRRSIVPFADGVTVSVADGRELCAENPGAFDRVLVDAPCTGLGALRRRPEARWRKSPGDVPELVTLQRELLSAALGATTVGGVVAYVTCSPLTAETVEVVQWVLSHRREAEALDTAAVMSRIAPTLTNARRGTAVQLYPHRHHTDAMFVQLIRRTR
jgi:16S rRNA (cytosine967-C5)-methyltransferase